MTRVVYANPDLGLELEMLVQGGTYVDPETGQPDDGVDLVDFYLEVEEDSMSKKDSPIDRVQALEEASFLLGPVAQASMAIGLMPDIVKILDRTGERIGWPNMSKALIPLTPLAQEMMIMGQMGAPQPGDVMGLQNSGGDKAPLNMIPGGGQGQIMRNTMQGNPMMKENGKRVSKQGQQTKKTGAKGKE
jgi:hypothetical protein